MANHLTVPQLQRVLKEMNVHATPGKSKSYYVYKLEQAQIQAQRQEWEWVSSHDQARPGARSQNRQQPLIQNGMPRRSKSPHRQMRDPPIISRQRFKRSVSPPLPFKQFKEPPPDNPFKSERVERQSINRSSTTASIVSKERPSKSRERKVDHYKEIKRGRTDNQERPPPPPADDNERRLRLQRLREKYIQKETRRSFCNQLFGFLIFLSLICVVGWISYNFYQAWKNPVYCSAQTKKPEGLFAKSLNFIKGQKGCVSCPDHGECQSGKLICKCPYIERYGECVEDPNEQTQIHEFVENLLDTLRNSGGEKICEGDSQIKDSLTSAQIINLFHQDVGGRCNVRSMQVKLQEAIFSREDEFQVQKEQKSLTVYRAKYPELSYECQINLFLRDNILAVILGSLTLLYIVFKLKVCFTRCKWQRKAECVFKDLKMQLQSGRVEEEELHSQLEEGVIAQFQKILSRDRSVSRFQKIVGGKPTFFLEKRN